MRIVIREALELVPGAILESICHHIHLSRWQEEDNYRQDVSRESSTIYNITR